MLRNRMASWWCNHGVSRYRHSRNFPGQDSTLPPDTRQHQDARKPSDLPYSLTLFLVNVELTYDRFSMGRWTTSKYTAHGSGVPAGEMLVTTCGRPGTPQLAFLRVASIFPLAKGLILVAYDDSRWHVGGTTADGIGKPAGNSEIFCESRKA